MRIFRISNFLFLLLAVCCGVLLFWTSQAVQQKEELLASTQKKLTEEKETIRVLSVEWDYLNRPQRLEKLATEQLGMELPSAKEVVSNVADIPEPAVMDEDIVPASLSTAPAKPAIAEPSKKQTISPPSAEKQSFDKLIQSLDDKGEGQ